jgi:hypothetical protein
MAKDKNARMRHSTHRDGDKPSTSRSRQTTEQAFRSLLRALSGDRRVRRSF